MPMFAARRLLASLLTGLAALGAAGVSAQQQQQAPAADGAQRVLERLLRGESAREAIDAMRGQLPATSPDAGRSADMLQLQQSEQALADALRAYAAGSGTAATLAARYEAWRAAVLVVEIKFASAGERLKQSADGAGYVGRHAQAQAQVQRAFAELRTLLDPVLAPAAKPSDAALRNAAGSALALLQRQHKAAGAPLVLRTQPVPFGGLGLAPRQPLLSPAIVPSYEKPAETTPAPEDRAATPYAPLSDEIVAKARSLDNDFVRIYEFVRNSTRNEWYAGAVKGAVGVLRSGAGNDVDQATLLTALLRAAGLSTRYVQGAVEMPLERLATELGLPASEAAQVPAALSKAGMAFAPVVQGGRVAAVQLARTWVSAFVPYTNYRGALVDASGKSWIPLDPFYKSVKLTASTGWFGRTFGAAALTGEYQQRSTGSSFADFLRVKTANALSTARIAGGWQGQLRTSSTEALQLDILPNSLPYAGAVVTRESAELPAAEQGSVRIRLYGGSRTSDPLVLDKTLSLADAANNRLTLSYGPASLEDHRLALMYGGIDAVPLYLIGLRGQLKLGGDIAAEAQAAVQPGATLKLAIDLVGPWGTQTVEQDVMAGAYQALVIANDPQRPTLSASADGERLGARLLDGLGVYYARQWNTDDGDIAAWLDAGVVRPVPAVTIVSTTLKPTVVAGVPVTLQWTGVSIDAALRPVDAVGAKADDFLALSALAGSSLEQVAFKDQFSVQAISADRGFQLAAEQGIPMLDLSTADAPALAATDHTDGVKTAVNDLLRQGLAVRLPARQLTDHAWTGSVWQAFRAGHAGYFIAGGLAGGETVIPPEQWPLAFLADAFAAMQTEEANNDPMSGVKVEKIGVADGQRGTVGEELPVPLTVLVRDKLGRPVKGAQVTFSVIGGDALLDGGSSFSAPTNVLGMATVKAKLGTSTSKNPVWILRNPGDEFSTQVGYISIDVSVDSSAGKLQPPEPYAALALPGPLSDLFRKDPGASGGFPSETADVISLFTIDQYQNPVANVVVDFSINSPANCPPGGSGGSFQPGALWNASVAANACPNDSILGRCGSPSLRLKSASNGVVFAGVILSNELGGTNVVSAGANGISKSYTYKAFFTCQPKTPVDNYWGRLAVLGGEYDRDGNLMSATKPGDTYPETFQVTYFKSERPYFIDENGTAQFLPFFNWVPASGRITDLSVSGGGSAARSGDSFRLTTGPAPARNDAVIDGRVTVNGVRNVGGRAEPFTQELSGRVGNSVFGVVPTITGAVSQNVPAGTNPNNILLDGRGLSLYPVLLNYRIDPPEYKVTDGRWIADILMDGAFIDYAAGDKGSGEGKALLPRSMPFEPQGHRYQSRMTMRGQYTQLKGEPYDLPLRQKLIADMGAAGASRFVDEINKRVCDRVGTVDFILTQEGRIKITYQSMNDQGELLGSPSDLVSEKTYPAGANEELIDASKLGSGKFQIVVSGFATADPTITDQAKTRISVLYQLQNSLPVGQVLVQGVNVRNGILSFQTPRLSIPGRGLPYDFGGTYSSAGAGRLSTLGANWSHNLDLGLTINSCGEVSVAAGDSGSVRFFPKADGTMVPDKGYHGTLVASRGDNSWDFYSKDGTQYHYTFQNFRVQWKLAFIKDRNGNLQTFNYDTTAFPDPLLSSVTRSDGRNLSFTYERRNVQRPLGDLSGPVSLLTKVSGAGGTGVTIDYDATGNLTSYIVNGRSAQFAYSTDASIVADRYRMVSATNAKGEATTYEYLQQPLVFNGRDVVAGKDLIVMLDHLVVRSLKTPLGGNYTFTIDSGSWASSSITGPGVGAAYTFNQYGNPLTIVDGAGTTRMSWAADDVLMTSKTDARGVTTTYGYDDAGNVTSTSVGGATARYTYEIMGGPPYRKSVMTSRTDLNGNVTQFGLDGNGNVVIERQPIGTLQHSYAGNGDRLSTTDANGNVTRFEYDAYGNVSASINPVGARLLSTRDERGRIVEVTDGNGNRVVNSYDGLDNLIGQKTPAGTRSSSFDALGNKTSETDEGGRTTSWTYAPGSVATGTKISGPGGSASRSFSYDAAGNKTSETDWNGNTTRYVYDDVSRLSSRTEPLGKVTSYTYDGAGNLLTESVDGRTTTHTYNPLGHRVSTLDAMGKEWKYTVDANGNRTGTTDPLGRSTTMSYDAMNRLTAVSQPLGRSTRYTYDAAGNKTGETDPNGNTTSYAYDTANRLITLTHPDGTTVGYAYDTANNLVRQTDEGGGVTTHTYDAMNRRLSTRDPEGGVTSNSYDALGNVVGETWPNGNAFTHAYDLFNRRVSSSDSIGSVGSWDYDDNGNLVAETDGKGNRSTHTYNTLNFRTASNLPGGRSLSFTPDRFGNVTRSTDARGTAVVSSFDKLNRLTQRIFADGGTLDTGYDDAGNRRTQSDARGNVTRYEVDDLNRVVKTIDPLGGTVANAYDPVGNLVSETDKRGTVTTHTYDTMNRRTGTTKAGIPIEALSYTALGKVATSTDANGNATAFTYDRRGLVTARKAPEGANTLYARDAMGDVLRETDPEGRITTTTYDARRRQTAVANGAGETTHQAFDLANNRITVTRPSGAATSFTYDASNWLVGVAEPEGRSSAYQRDLNGNLTRFTDGMGRATAYDHDALNRRTGVTYPGGAAETFVFDKAGNPTTHTDANGIVVTRSFDLLNREVRKSYSASADGLSSITTAYDENGNITSVVENYGGTSRTSTYTYDAFDRELTAQDAFGGRIAHGYDRNGNRVTLGTQDARQTRYGYDGLNRLTGVNGPAGGVQYVYDRSGLPTQQAWSNGASTSTSYDAARRTRRIELARNGSVYNLTDYSYDNNGNRLTERINRPGDAALTTYGYDAADRLTRTQRVSGGVTTTTTWTYDKADNRLSESVSPSNGPGISRSYAYDGRSRLTSISDSAAGNTTLSYDPQGNLLQKVQGGDTTSYVWNARDHLVSVSRNGSVLGRYSTDHVGLRVSKEALNPLQPQAPPRVLTTQFDDDNAVQDRDGAGTVVARYDFAGRRPVALWSAEDGNQLLHADALGSIIATTAANGSIKSETLYDAWGNPLVQAGISANKFAYTGHQVDAETGLYYFKARYYDPTIGRFISQDPAEGQDDRPASYQRYLYAYGNPTIYYDPDGRIALLKEGAEALGEFGDWLRGRASMCDEGVLCKVAAATIGVSRAVVGLGEMGLRATNVAANTTSLALATLGLNSQANADAHAAELEGTINAAKASYKAVSTQEGRAAIGDKVFGTVEKAIAGDSGAISDISEFAAGFVGGGGAAKNAARATESASAVVRTVERAAAREALEGTATAAKAVGEMAESTVAKQAGRMTAEGLSGPTVEGVAGRTVKSVEAEASMDALRARAREAGGEARVAERGGSTGCPCCFVGTTPVLTDAGLMPIERIGVGTMVVSRDEKTGQSSLKPVNAVLRYEGRDLYALVMVDETGHSSSIEVSDNHPFWVDGKQWVESAKLQPGMRLTTADGRQTTVASLNPLGRTQTTYNLSVDEYHTYFAGATPVLVHNTCVCGVGAKPSSASSDLVRYKPREELTAQAGSRSAAIDRAWAQEKRLVEATGAGTRAWSGAEKELILGTKNSELTSVMSKQGYTGHHINSVEGNGALGAKWQGDPRNIVFLENYRHPNSTSGLGAYNEHFHALQGHRGSTGNASVGRLIDREAMIKRAAK